MNVHTKAQLRQMLSIAYINLIETMSMEVSTIIYNYVNTKEDNKFNINLLKIDDDMNVVDGPCYDNSLSLLEICGALASDRKHLLTCVYRSWVFAALLQQYDMAWDFFKFDPVEVIDWSDNIKTNLWKMVCKYRISSLWKKFRAMVITRPIVLYLQECTLLRVCAEGGSGRLADKAAFVGDAEISKMLV